MLMESWLNFLSNFLIVTLARKVKVLVHTNSQASKALLDLYLH